MDKAHSPCPPVNMVDSQLRDLNAEPASPSWRALHLAILVINCCGMPALNTVSCYGCGGVPWWVSVCVCGLCKTACPLQCGQTSNLRRPRTQLTERKECPSTSCPVLWAACMLKFSGVPQIVAREARPHSNAFLGEALDPNRTIACLLLTLTVVCFLVRGLGRELKSFLFVSLALPLLRQACIIWVLHCFLLNSFYSIEF